MKKGKERYSETGYKKQLEYVASYRKSNIISLNVSLNKTYDADVIDHLNSVENKSAYIKGLVRKDMEEK